MDIDPTYEFNAPKFFDFEALDASEDHADEVFDFQIVGDIATDAPGQDAAISKFQTAVTVQAARLPSGRGLSTVQLVKADHPPAPRSEHKRSKFPSGRRQWAVYADAPRVAVALADVSRSNVSPDLREALRRPVRTVELSVAATSGPPSRATAVGRTLLRQPLRSVQPVAVGGVRLPGAPSDGHRSASSKLVPSKRTPSTKSTDGHRTCADENWRSVPSSFSRLGHAFADDLPMGSHGSSCPISSFPVKISEDEPQRNACRFTTVRAPPADRSLSPAAAVVEPSICCGPITSGDADGVVTKSLELAKPDLFTRDIAMAPADVVDAAQQTGASASITQQVPVAEAADNTDGHRQQTHVTSVLLGDVTSAAPVTDDVSTCGKIDKPCVTFARVAGGSCKRTDGLAKSTTGSFRKQDEDRRANAGDIHRFVHPNKRVLISDRATGANALKVGRLGPRSGIGHSNDTAKRQPLQTAASRLNSLRPANGDKPSADPSYSRPALARVKRDADRQLTAAATAASHASSRLLGTGAVKEVGAAAKPAASARQPLIPPARSTGRQVFATECRRPQRQQQQQKQQPLPGARQQPKERSQSSRPPPAAASLSHATAVMSTTVLAAGSHVHHRSPGHITRYKPLVIRRSSRAPTKPVSPHFSTKVSKKSGLPV